VYVTVDKNRLCGNIITCALQLSKNTNVHAAVLRKIMQGSILPVTIPPWAHPRGFAIFFLLGGLFPTPWHAERNNSPPLGLLIDHKYVVLCSKLISVQ